MTRRKQIRRQEAFGLKRREPQQRRAHARNVGAFDDVRIVFPKADSIALILRCRNCGSTNVEDVVPATVLEAVLNAAQQMDWKQVVLNGGPPCFHLEAGRFCGRAARWDGHDASHKFVSFAYLLSLLAQREWLGFAPNLAVPRVEPKEERA